MKNDTIFVHTGVVFRSESIDDVRLVGMRQILDLGLHLYVFTAPTEAFQLQINAKFYLVRRTLTRLFYRVSYDVLG